MEKKLSSSKKRAKNEEVKSEQYRLPKAFKGNSYFSLFTLSLFTFFILAWLWSAWWMGSVFRVAYEQSFFAADATLMHFLIQQPFGWLWLVGRAALTLYRWPILGGLVVALLLTATTWNMAQLLPHRATKSFTFHILHFTYSILPATMWMSWTAWTGLNLFYEAEPGRHLAILLMLCILSCILTLSTKILNLLSVSASSSNHPSPSEASSNHPSPSESPSNRPSPSVAYAAVSQQPQPQSQPQPQPLSLPLFILSFSLPFLLAFATPVGITHFRHPYARPITQMQVQMLHNDWNSMVATARDNAALSYRPLAAFYAVALVHTGHLTDAFFDIRLDYDTLYLRNYSQKADLGTNYYLIDCDYTAGLFRAATHKAMEHLTMNGPTLYSLKHLTRLALLDNAWPLANKYLQIIGRAPFESDFVERYSAMLNNPDAVAADPEFALLRRTEPFADSFESEYQSPTFLGYTATLLAGRSQDALMQSLMANLYSKRMPDFLMRTQPLVGSVPPRTIAEGLVTQISKNPDILKAFPQLQMNAQAYQAFIQSVQHAMKDRPAHARELFDSYHGYYPYYYFFGNLKATRKSDERERASSNAGVN